MKATKTSPECVNRASFIRALKYALFSGMILALCAIPQYATAQIQTTPISECGTVITSPGIYIVTKSLQTTEDKDCITIKASGVSLVLGRFDLTGPGGKDVTAAGISILPEASGVGLGLGGGDHFGIWRGHSYSWIGSDFRR